MLPRSSNCAALADAQISSIERGAACACTLRGQAARRGRGRGSCVGRQGGPSYWQESLNAEPLVCTACAVHIVNNNGTLPHKTAVNVSPVIEGHRGRQTDTSRNPALHAASMSALRKQARSVRGAHSLSFQSQATMSLGLDKVRQRKKNPRSRQERDDTCKKKGKKRGFDTFEVDYAPYTWKRGQPTYTCDPLVFTAP